MPKGGWREASRGKTGAKPRAIVKVQRGGGSAVKISDTTLIALRLLTLQAQQAEQDETINESEIVRRLVDAATKA